MEFAFYLQDRYGQLTAIPDPIGWDGLCVILSRDKDLHGLFFDFQGNDFEYQGKAAKKLRDEYNANGIQGYMLLVINYICDGQEANLYTGKFLFGALDDDYGDDCNVKPTLPPKPPMDILLGPRRATLRQRSPRGLGVPTSPSSRPQRLTL